MDGDVIVDIAEDVATPGNEAATLMVIYDITGPTVVTQDISVQLDDLVCQHNKRII
ncbi:MAG: hypothetical protein HRT72_04575 [Flavobacteriales bacterium]|nr:hypothetical protein [Flavobacteriales bacterium]